MGLHTHSSAYLGSAIFDSFFMGGFECSTHLRTDGRRLDVAAATRHNRTAVADYLQLKSIGLRTFRDGLRWHLIERAPGRYDWGSAQDSLEAARRAGVQVIWDLLHYGWPDHLDIWSDDFVQRFAAFAAGVAELVKRENGAAVPFYCPVNEISYFAWAGGDEANMNPFCRGQGIALKRQLVRAAIAATDAIRAVEPRARFVYAEPLINVVAASRDDAEHARGFHQAQYQAMDMLTGRIDSELGGGPDYLDLLGANYYPENQWVFGGAAVPFGHHSYRPLSDMIKECYERYQRPLLISETGAEGSARAAWLYYVTREVLAAKRAGIEVGGICLYPVLDYPGWSNSRICEAGLLGVADSRGERSFHQPLLGELIASADYLRRQLAPAPDNL